MATDLTREKPLCLDKMRRERNVKERERGIEKERENNKKDMEVQLRCQTCRCLEP